MNMKITRYRSARGMIVRLLTSDYGNFTTLKALQSMLDKRGYSLSMDDVRFHVTYLAEQNLVTVKRARDLQSFEEDSTLSPEDIVMVKLAALGLQLSNGSHNDPEVTY